VTTTATTFDTRFSSSPSSSPGPSGLVAWYAEGTTDPLGDRLHLFDNAGPALELLRIRGDLAVSPGFEAALRLRVSELEGLRHPALARVRSVTILDDPSPALALVSELADGQQLTTLLLAFEQAGVRPDVSAAVWLLRRVLPALAALHDCGPAVSHGMLTPNRIVLAPGGGLVVTEIALGAALATLGRVPDEAWREFGVAHRAGDGGRWAHRTNDIAQVAYLAAAILLGRPLRLADLASGPALIDDACGALPSAGRLQPWLRRAIGPDGVPFESATDALAALEDMMRGVLEAWPGPLVPLPDGSLRAPAPALPAPTDWAPAVHEIPAAPSPRLLPAVAEVSPPRRVAGWLRVANAALVTVALAEAVVVLAQFARGPSPAVKGPELMQLVKPAIAHAATSSMANAPAPADAPPAAIEPSAVAAKPAAARDPVGWVLVRSRVPVEVSANGTLLGTSTDARYRLPAGHHTLTIENTQHGISFTEPLDLAVGQTVLVSANR
jgi:hypothetical protein